MRFIRQRFVLRVFSIFSILLLLNTVIYPTVSYALTTGPHQPEYTSYEDASSVDMVNLLTGDFNYTMPILSVPIGSEGNFTVPLSYHAGVGTDMESSWIGLGFNINVGSITRNINGFPDDASGESQTINVKDLTGNRGWYSNSLLGQYGWDSQAGHYGSLTMGSLTVNYNKVGTDVGLAGIHVGKAPRFDAVEFGVTIARLVADILTEGAAEVEGLAVNVTMDIGNHAMVASSFTPPQAPNLGGYWEYSQHTDNKLLGAYKNYWYWLDKTRVEDMYGTMYLNKVVPSDYINSPYYATIKMNVNGLQPVKQFPISSDILNKGSASDINIDLSNNTNYIDNMSPTLLAYDNFQVNGPGISGGIKPYRMEVGSVSVPREMTQNHIRLDPVPFIDYGSNKVPFVYDGSISNRYFNHVGGNSTVTTPTFNYGIDVVGEIPSNPPLSQTNYDAIRFDLSDVTFSTQRLGSNITSRQKIAQGNFVDWLTNGEIGNTTGKFLNTSFMDYFSPASRSVFRTAYQFGGNNTYYGTSATGDATANTSTIVLASMQDVSAIKPNYVVDVNLVAEYKDPDGNVIYTNSTPYTNVVVQSVSNTQIVIKNTSAIAIASSAGHVEIVSKNSPKSPTSIGGFVITSMDGMNYHYALPAYDYNFSSKTVDKTDANKNSTLSRSGQFANTWLLTAITGPDFVDRGGTAGDGDGYIDENDWGYWIKFNYGNQSTDYMWRFPYSSTGTTADPADKYLSYSQGLKEKYYLNSIESRSHVALFLKGSRNDAKDASSSKKPSLRLCEIALVTRDSYKQLIDPAGTLKLQDCSGTKDVLYQYSGSTTGKDITASQESFIQANALRRVLFNSGKTTTVADYTLCQGASNSDAGYGKLTLNSISVLGRNSAKVLPDYKFTYGNNPTYNVDKWDGFGMYSSIATSAGNTHGASTVSNDAAAWSLTSIKSPLGHSIDVSYERDTYSSVSGQTSSVSTNYTTSVNYTVASSTELRIPNSIQYKPGDQVIIEGNITSCHCSTDASNTLWSVPMAYGGTYQVTSVNSTSIFLNQNFGIPCPVNSTANLTYTGTIKQIVPSAKRGGNLRVGSITLNDNGGQQYKTRYLYEENGVSSGVISVEPQYIRTTDNDFQFYKSLNYPATPVIYGKVSVLTGTLSTDADYAVKTVYEFETPDQSQYVVNANPKVKDKVLISSWPNPHGNPVLDYASLLKFEIQKTTSKIGKLKSIKVFDNSNSSTPYSSQSYIYSSSLLNGGVNNYQGVFSEGTILNEVVTSTAAGSVGYKYHKGQKTTVLDYPYVLQKVISTVDGQTSESMNTSWDLITGTVLEKQDKSPLGLRTKTTFDPLYQITGSGTEYYKLGSKASDPSYKNMLSQVAATYNYLIDDNGNELGLLSARVTTWKKDLTTYSILNGGVYGPSADLDLNGDNTVTASETATAQVWRKSGSYVWMGDKTRLNSSGVHTFSSTDKFNFASVPTSLWKKTGSFERFDHNSQILEAKDIHGIFSSSKYGYNSRLLLASAVNASYYEMAYSGAEDRLNSTSAFFGGEVGLGTGSSVVTTPLHTGKLALSVPSGSYGFVYKTPLTTGILPNKKYRVSVWTTNSTNGKIYYKINSNGVAGTEMVPTSQTISAPILLNGNTWYRLDTFIDIGNVTIPSIEVGVKSIGGNAVFDDFRFQPADAAMSCNVYNPITYNLEYVLDNDNVYTRYEYNDQGVLVKTYFESFRTGQVGERLINETKSDFRRFYIDK